MSKKSLSVDRGLYLFDSVLSDESRFPLSFTYNGRQYASPGAFPCVSRIISQTAAGRSLNMEWQVDENLFIRAQAQYHAEYGQSEYTVYFENRGHAPSGILEKISALDLAFEGDDPFLRGILGDHENWYAPYKTDLSRQDAYHASLGGRATHVCFPYFNLVHGNGGTLIALGWAGTWNALFTKTGSGTRAIVRSNPSMKTVLLPGETIRTGLIVLLPYSGRDEQDAMNLWREWFIRCNMPRFDVTGKAVEPFSTAFFAYDTGLPNSDGSISERWFTWKPSLDKILAEGLHPDFRWFDAGWYADPAGNTVESKWWHTIGTWEIDPAKWPGDTFRESVDEFHRHGIRTYVWFEPERTTHVEEMVKNHSYKAEWAIEAGGAITNNIGNPECLQWTTKRITDMMSRHNVDLYREDNNANHNLTWRLLDQKSSEELGQPRYGIAENNSIVGHYQLWDNILAFCAENGKCTFLDSCASGGGRNDIESLRRGVPFLRSDGDRTTTGIRLSMTASFNQWIPFHGASTKETTDELEASKGAGSDSYVYRASYLPIFHYSEAYTHNPLLDYDTMRRFIGEWKSISHLLTRDMYVLTPWHQRTNLRCWTVFAYDAPDAGQSILLAFRQEECEEGHYTVRLPFAEDNADYALINADTKEEIVLSGAELQKGLTLTLNEKRSSLLLRINRL